MIKPQERTTGGRRGITTPPGGDEIIRVLVLCPRCGRRVADIADIYDAEGSRVSTVLDVNEGPDFTQHDSTGTRVILARQWYRLFPASRLPSRFTAWCGHVANYEAWRTPTEAWDPGGDALIVETRELLAARWEAANRPDVEIPKRIRAAKAAKSIRATRRARH